MQATKTSHLTAKTKWTDLFSSGPDDQRSDYRAFETRIHRNIETRPINQTKTY